MEPLKIIGVIFTIFLAIVISLLLRENFVPPGHLQPLGSQMPPIPNGIQVLHYLPTPNEFWDEYIKSSKPVLFKNVTRNFSTFCLWNDNYLSLHYGHYEVMVETQAKENRNLEAQSMLLSEFLRRYQNEELYMISILYADWLSDVAIPKPIQCGNLQKSLNHINLWMSNGRTKSVLHRDSMDNIHCVLTGNKKIFLVNKTFDKAIPVVNGEGYSEVDIEQVDMYKYSGLQNLPWYNVSVEADDCIFIPYMWFHQVTSSDERNLAINWWFHHLLWFNFSDCYNKQLEEWLPSYNFHFPNKMLKHHYQLIQLAIDHLPLSWMTFNNLYQKAKCDHADLTELFVVTDKDKNGVLSVKEMYEVNSAMFDSFFVNCNESSTHEEDIF